ncbi:MAG: hypothetical protein GY726_16520 [Proteobacteria bacterium]|nr:hypothetical protein [Pseudomonadota bacterium]
MNQIIDRAKVDQALEMVCDRGCITVKEIIKEIEQGALPGPARKLNTGEYEIFLLELRAVMQTYV